MVNTRIEMGLTPPIAKVMMSVEDGVVVVVAKVQEDDVQSATMAERANS